MGEHHPLVVKKVPKKDVYLQKTMSHAFTERALLYKLAHTHPFLCRFGGFFHDPNHLCVAAGRMISPTREPPPRRLQPSSSFAGAVWALRALVTSACLGRWVGTTCSSIAPAATSGTCCGSRSG